MLPKVATALATRRASRFAIVSALALSPLLHGCAEDEGLPPDDEENYDEAGQPSVIPEAGVDASAGSDAGDVGAPRGDAGSDVDGGAADASAADGGAADAAAVDAQAGADPNAVAPGAYCDPVRAWPAQSATFEDQVLQLTNEARAVARRCGATNYAAVGPLMPDPKLRCAARMHSQYMAMSGDFAHTSRTGATMAMRIDSAGFRARAAGENIARGQSTPKQVVDGWLKSEGHCVNIMNGRFTHLGVGYATGLWNGRQSPYWTQNFGTPF